MPIQLLDAQGTGKTTRAGLDGAGCHDAGARRLRLQRQPWVEDRNLGQGQRLRRLARVRAGAGADPLPAGTQAGARPAAGAGLVDQHPRPDRVPAGDRPRRRLRRQQVRQRESGAAERSQDPLGTSHRPERPRQADRRHGPGLPRRPRLLRLPRRQPGRGRRQDRQDGLGAQPPLPPRILADGRRRRDLSRHRHHRRRRPARHRRQAALALQLAGGDQSQPELPRRAHLRRRLRGLDVRARRRPAASRSGAPTRPRSRPSAAAASSPRRPSTSATSTPPATTAPSSPSTKRPARSPGPSRPATTSTARPRSPASPAPRRASTSAPKTAASSPSTPAAASAAGTTTSAARSPARHR